MSEDAGLWERVKQFNEMRLPGQPVSMHMGTLYLVHDLARELREAREVIQSLLWPHVPSADDFRLLIIVTGGTSDSANQAMLLADTLEKEQKAANAFLERTK